MANKPTPTGGSAARQRLLNTFSIDFHSTVDDKRYKGRFTSKKLTIRDLAALGVRKAQLNGGMHYDLAHPGHGVDEQTDEFNNMVAHLEISIVEAPKWWNLDEITDVSLVGQVYKEVVSFENTFLGAVSGDSDRDDTERDSEGSGEGVEEDATDSGAVSAVVGEEVSAALQP